MQNAHFIKDFEIPRVEQVTDPVVIARLQKQCQKMCKWHRYVLVHMHGGFVVVCCFVVVCGMLREILFFSSV